MLAAAKSATSTFESELPVPLASKVLLVNVVVELAVTSPVALIVSTPAESVDVVTFEPPCMYNVSPAAMSSVAESSATTPND